MITITHTPADGTLIDGSRKGDGVYDVLRSLRDNWRYFPSIRRIGLGQSRDKPANTARIRRAADALRAAGQEVAVSIDDTEARTFAEAEQDRYDRAEARAERLGAAADRAAARSTELHARAEQMREAIPFGQPMMPDHYSYGRDRRYRERIHTTYQRSWEAGDQAREYEHRAGNAESYQADRENVPTTLRRIEKLEADRRRWDRRLHGTGHAMHGEDKPATGGYAERLTRMIAEADEQIAYWRDIVAKAEASGVKVWGPGDFAKGEFVLAFGCWAEILRVNPKSLSIVWGTNFTHVIAITTENAMTGMGPGYWRDTVPYDKVTARKTAAEIAELIAASPVGNTRNHAA